MVSARLETEESFHDRWASELNHESISIRAAFEGSTSPENRFILRHLGDVNGKLLLDLGCGAGENSIYFAGKGANCVAGDWSSGMIRITQRLAESHCLHVDARRLNAMEIDFPDDTFDVVYASNLLHHVEPRRALREIHRILKKGGKACIWDPLRHNPVINIYRRIASEVRTKDERPLSFLFIGEVRNLFSHVVYDTFWLSTLWIFLKFYFIEKVDPNKERYWKKIINEEPRLRNIYNRLEKLDHLLKRIPLMKRFAWNIAIIATK